MNIVLRFFGTVALSLLLPAVLYPQRILVNQAGYLTSERKFVVTDFAADSFFVLTVPADDVVFGGKLSLRTADDAVSGFTSYEGDFTNLNTPGAYRVKAGPTERSVSFLINDTVYADVLKKSLKGMFFQRCGTQLPVANAGIYFHSACHTGDATFHATAESSGTISAAGGWHDAGDYGKYVVNAGISAGTLLMAYEFASASFSSDMTGIPESGNGIPDILDEVRYELTWFLTMQSADGGVFTKLTKNQFESFVMPQSDAGTRYIFQISSTATANLAAVTARAARVYASFDPSFAATCLTAARRAWSFLAAHPEIVPPGGFKNPEGTATGEYGDSDDRDERLWAAAELFAATHEGEYGDYFHLLYPERGIFPGAMSWQNVTSLAQLTYLTTSGAHSSEPTLNDLKSGLLTRCGNILTTVQSSGLHVSLGVGEFTWGSNSAALNNAILLIVGSELFGSEEFRESALDQLHYVLGINAVGMTYVTGIGEFRPLYPHHRPSAADRIPEPVPGLLVGGPNQYLNDPILAERFTSSTPPAQCYVDEEESYASNEIAINWNAPLVFVSGYFAGGEPGTGMQETPRPLTPQRLRLGQNYPNPFNPTTSIGLYIADRALVKLAVFDVLGREVATLIDEEKPAGEYQVVWNATAMPSGTYFAKLYALEGIQSRAMILIK